MILNENNTDLICVLTGSVFLGLDGLSVDQCHSVHYRAALLVHCCLTCLSIACFHKLLYVVICWCTCC